MSKNYVVISTDGHAGAQIDTYKEYLPAKWHEEFEAWRGQYKNPFRDLQGSKRYRNWDSDARINEQEDDGIVAEVLFPNTVPPFFPSASFMAPAPKTKHEYDRRWAGLQAHNRWLADFCALAPERRAGIAQILLNDVDDAVTEIHWVKEQGLRGGVVIPGVPPDSHLPPLYAPEYEPIWRTCAELGVPLNHHSGGAAPNYGKYAAAPVLWLLETSFFSHRAFWHLLFGGVFERNPDLRFILAESGMSWIASEMPKTDAMAAQIFSGKVGELGFTDEQRLPRLPSEYFNRQVWITASFLNPLECRRRHEVGVDRIMWANDYPHDEGTYPYSKESFRLTFEGVPEDEVRKILGETAAHVYDFDLAKLQEHADRVGPSPEYVATPLDEIPPSESPAFSRR